MSINVNVHGNPVCIRRGRPCTVDPEYVDREFHKRRRIRLEQVREQSRNIAGNLRNKVRKVQQTRISEVERKGAAELKEWQAKKLVALQKQYGDCLKDLGLDYDHVASENDDNVSGCNSEVRARVALDRTQRAVSKHLRDQQPLNKMTKRIRNGNVRRSLNGSFKEEVDKDPEMNPRRNVNTPQLRPPSPSPVSDHRSKSPTEINDRLRGGSPPALRNRSQPKGKAKAAPDPKQATEADPKQGTSAKVKATPAGSPERKSACQPPTTLLKIPCDSRASPDYCLITTRQGKCTRGVQCSPKPDTDLSFAIKLSDIEKSGGESSSPAASPGKKKRGGSKSPKKQKGAKSKSPDGKKGGKSPKKGAKSPKKGAKSPKKGAKTSEAVTQSEEESATQTDSAARASKCMGCMPVITRISDRIKCRCYEPNEPDLGDMDKYCGLYGPCDESTSKPPDFQAAHISRSRTRDPSTCPEPNFNPNACPHCSHIINKQDTIPPKPAVNLLAIPEETERSTLPPCSTKCMSEVRYYDHANRFEKRYVTDNANVKKIPPCDLQRMESEGSDVDFSRHVYKNEKDAATRGKKAMAKEKVTKDYKQLMKELPALEKQERLATLSTNKSKFHMSEQRLKEQEQKKQQQMDKAYEKLFPAAKPVITIAPKVPHSPAKAKGGPAKGQGMVNVGSWDVGKTKTRRSDGKMDAGTSAATSNQDRSDRLIQMLAELSAQRDKLIKELCTITESTSKTKVMKDIAEVDKLIKTAASKRPQTKSNVQSSASSIEEKSSRYPAKSTKHDKPSTSASSSKTVQIPSESTRIAIRSKSPPATSAARSKSPPAPTTKTVATSPDPCLCQPKSPPKPQSPKTKSKSPPPKSRSPPSKPSSPPAKAKPPSKQPSKSPSPVKKKPLVTSSSDQSTSMEEQREQPCKTLTCSKFVDATSSTEFRSNNSPPLACSQCQLIVPAAGTCRCLSDTIMLEELCEIRIKLNDKGPPQICVNPKRLDNDELIIETLTQKDRDTMPAQQTRDCRTQSAAPIRGTRDTQTRDCVSVCVQAKTSSKKVAKKKVKTPKKSGQKNRAVKGQKGKSRGISWQEQLSQTALSSSTSYYSPPGLCQPGPPDRNRTCETTCKPWLKQQQQRTEIDTMKYIKKLLSMSRRSVDELAVSSVSEVSTPSSSLMNVASNNPAYHLQTILKFLQVGAPEFDRLTATTSSARANTYETAPTSTTNFSNGECSTSTTISSKSTHAHCDCPTDFDHYSANNYPNVLTAYNKLAENCAKKIENLTAMIEQVRSEKMSMMQSGTNTSESDKENSTRYFDIPETMGNKEQQRKVDFSSPPRSPDQKKLDAKLTQIDYDYVAPPTSQTTSGSHADSDPNGSDREMRDRYRQLMNVDRDSDKDRIVAMVTQTQLLGDPLKYGYEQLFIPLLSDIPKLPKLDETVKMDRLRPPTSKGITIAKRFNNEIDTSPHELSTIVEADSQMSIKSPEKKQPQPAMLEPHIESMISAESSSDDDEVGADLLDGLSVGFVPPSSSNANNNSDTSYSETMETLLEKMGMGWAVSTLKKTQTALALSSSSSSTDSKQMRRENNVSGESTSNSEVSLRDFLARQFLTRLSPSERSDSVDTSGRFMRDLENSISALHASSGSKRTSTPVQKSNETE